MQSQRTSKRPLKMRNSTSFVMSGPNQAFQTDRLNFGCSPYGQHLSRGDNRLYTHAVRIEWDPRKARANRRTQRLLSQGWLRHVEAIYCSIEQSYIQRETTRDARRHVAPGRYRRRPRHALVPGACLPCLRAPYLAGHSERCAHDLAFSGAHARDALRARRRQDSGRLLRGPA